MNVDDRLSPRAAKALRCFSVIVSREGRWIEMAQAPDDTRKPIPVRGSRG